MKWNDFLEKLAKAKKEKKIVGNVTSPFMNLIYSGAMDSFVEPSNKLGLLDYDLMFDELRKALKSKASKTKKRKSEMIGLAEVTNNVLLAAWRFQNNPISQFDLRKFCAKSRNMIGFTALREQRDIRGFMRQTLEEKGEIRYYDYFVTDEWQKFFENSALRKLFVESYGTTDVFYTNGDLSHKTRSSLLILGILVDKKISYTKTGKQRMVVTLFTGKEKTGEITFWPPKGQMKIDPKIIDDIKPLNLYAINVNLSEYNGKPGANVSSAYSKEGYIKVLDLLSDKSI